MTKKIIARIIYYTDKALPKLVFGLFIWFIMFLGLSEVYNAVGDNGYAFPAKMALGFALTIYPCIWAGRLIGNILEWADKNK